jgi:hypothetical protein
MKYYIDNQTLDSLKGELSKITPETKTKVNELRDKTGINLLNVGYGDSGEIKDIKQRFWNFILSDIQNRNDGITSYFNILNESFKKENDEKRINTVNLRNFVVKYITDNYYHFELLINEQYQNIVKVKQGYDNIFRDNGYNIPDDLRFINVVNASETELSKVLNNHKLDNDKDNKRKITEIQMSLKQITDLCNKNEFPLHLLYTLVKKNPEQLLNTFNGVIEDKEQENRIIQNRVEVEIIKQERKEQENREIEERRLQKIKDNQKKIQDNLNR